MIKRSILGLVCFQALSIPAGIYAAEADAAEADLLSLGEMVVTTRKREETLQEVPIAITAFSAQQIEDADIQSVEDIALMTPGFTYTPIFGGKVGNPVIRGASTTIGEPNVGFFIDGVYQESRGVMEAMFGDEIERIEIAKGPQSALYGRNTFAGAINYITKQPSNEREGRFEVTLGNEGRKDARFSHSGAITEDTLFYRVGAMHSGFDGFYKNELTGGDLDDKQSNVYSLSLLALPADNVEMVFRIGVENTNDGDDALQFVENNNLFSPTLGDFQIFSGDMPSLTNGFAVTPGHNERDNITSSFRLDWDLEQVTFTSITGYNDLELDSLVDADYEAREIRLSESNIESTEFSQEFRLTSIDQPIRWMTGVYFYDIDRESDLREAFVDGTPVSPLGGGRFPNLQSDIDESTRNWAAFGSLGFDLSDQLALTFSGRYAYEKKEIDVVDTNLTSLATAQFKDSASFNNFTPKVALDYQLTDNAMIYTSVAKAVKAGGFNSATASGAVLPNERIYDEEKSLNYEIGVKSSWLNNRLTANLALFYIDWEDQIVRALGETGAVLNTNAGESSSKGFELELAAKPSENWDLSAGLAYTDAEYDDYTFAAVAPLGLNPIADGNPLQFVSEWTANISVQYVKLFAIADFDWKTRIDGLYQSEQRVQALDEIGVIPDRTIFNLRSTLENDRYAITLWAKNLFDNDEGLGSIVIPNSAVWNDAGFGLRGVQAFQGLVQAPNERTFGLTASVKF